MNLRVILRAPDLLQPRVLDLPPGEALLVGRAPDVSRLAGYSGAPTERVQTLELLSPRVSGSHLLIQHDGDGAVVTDLRSSNGTWLQLVPGRAVRLSGGVATLDVARAAFAPLSSEPNDARWDRPEHFAREVLVEVGGWLRERGIRAEVSLLSRALDAPPPDTASFALANGSALLVRRDASTTLTSGWLTHVRVYVHRQNLLFEEERGHGDDFVMASKVFRDAHRRVVSAAQRGLPLVLLGESGSGKEVLARCYHTHSARREHRLEVVNCAAMLSENLVESALFGAVKGAYTGLTRNVDGALALAHGGTLFLDEIGELSERVQAMLLRFLNRRPGEYHRVGEPDKVSYSDAQLVTATNKDLEARVEAGHFRGDLWNRIAGEVVRIPPLRERRDDLEAFLRRRKVHEDHTVEESLTDAARALLMDHTWPGNFRDLDHFVHRLEGEMLSEPCDADTCRRLLRLKESPRRTSVIVRTPASETQPETGPTATKDPWRDVLDQATGLWLRDHEGRVPTLWGELKPFFEHYVKPLFLARACGVQESSAWPGNFSEMAERVGLKDGTSVRESIKRYERLVTETRE